MSTSDRYGKDKAARSGGSVEKVSTCVRGLFSSVDEEWKWKRWINQDPGTKTQKGSVMRMLEFGEKWL